MTVREYFEQLATEHAMVRHRQEEEPHFACSMDDAATLMARRLYYPAIFLQAGDLMITGTAGNEILQRDYALAVVDHVKDNGDEGEKKKAFDRTENILTDILARMIRDKRIGEKTVSRFSPVGCEAHRIENADAALYGWLLLFPLSSSLCTLNDNGHFTK